MIFLRRPDCKDFIEPYPECRMGMPIKKYHSRPRINSWRLHPSRAELWGNTVTDRPLANEIVAIKAVKDENRPKRYCISAHLVRKHSSLLSEPCLSFPKMRDLWGLITMGTICPRNVLSTKDLK